MRISFTIATVLSLATIPAGADPFDDRTGTGTSREGEGALAFDEGRRLLAADDAAGACVAFERANRLLPDSVFTLLNLGLCNERRDRVHTALGWYRAARTRAEMLGMPDQTKVADEHIALLAPKVPTLALQLAATIPSDARITLDGVAVARDAIARVEVDPGHHVILVYPSNEPMERRELDVAIATSQTISLGPPPVATVASVVEAAHTEAVLVDSGKRRRTASLGLVAAGVTLWSFAGAYGIRKKADYDAHRSTMAIAEANADVDDLRVYGTSMFVVGTLALGAAAYLYLSAPSPRISFVPAVGSDQVGLAAFASF